MGRLKLFFVDTVNSGDGYRNAYRRMQTISNVILTEKVFQTFVLVVEGNST